MSESPRSPSPQSPNPSRPRTLQPRPDLCTEEDVARLVHMFYARVRLDDALGSIFDEHVEDWDWHLARMVDFWSSMLRRTGRFLGSPMTKHAALPGLSAELFQRWLQLFRETAAEQPNQPMAELACAMAERVAQSLWMGYQISRDPDGIPATLASA